MALVLVGAGGGGAGLRAGVGETSEVLGLTALAGRDMFRLSGGERQKVACAGFWAMHP